MWLRPYLTAKIAPMPSFFSAFIAGIALVAFSAPCAIGQDKSKEVAPDVPDAIQAPANEQVILWAHGVGSQIYACVAGADGKFAWTLKAPDAELHDRNDKVVGAHSAGPTWKLKDGSEVTAKVVAHVDSLDADSIPWLLLKADSHTNKGLLSDVTTIQRVHTHGGRAPSEGCDAAHVNSETKSTYSADYFFYAPAK
jgi:hypothetical protein